MPRRLAQQRMTLNGRFAVRQYRQFRKGVHCDQMVHFSTDLTLWLDSPTSRHHYTLNGRFTIRELRQLRAISKLHCAYAHYDQRCLLLKMDYL